ncbi:MAG: hypothetical protein QXI32_06040, partial [Candidatus Bathyarchaeia archaeon]
MNTRRFIVVMIIALALWNGVLTIGHYLSSAERGQILVGVFYYVWYGEERHWNEDQQSVVVDIPSTKYYRGYYSSLNRTVICQQLKLIEEAGIDFVIISWTGIDTYEDKATQLVFRVIQEENLDVKAAIMVEPTEYYGCKGDFCELNETRIAQAKSYILDKYVHPYKKQYFFWEDRPLLAFFVPLNPPKDLIFSTRVVGNREFGDWPYWTIPPIVSYDGVVAVLPRHDDSRLQRSNPIVKDEDYSARLYDQQWEFVLAMKDKVKAVLITTWNEYHERTMIEPHIDATVRILGYEPDYLYKKTQTYIKQLNLRPVLFAFIYAFPSQLLLFTILYYAVVCITKIGNEQAKENVKNIKQLLLVGAFSRMLV